MDAVAFFLLPSLTGHNFSATAYPATLQNNGRLYNGHILKYAKDGAPCREDDVPPPLVNRARAAFLAGKTHGTL